MTTNRRHSHRMTPKSTASKSPLIQFALLLLGLLISSGSTHADLITLYDGNALPGDQPWLVFAADTLSGWSQTPAAGGTQLTTNNATRAGYSNYLPLPIPSLKNNQFPTLDRSNGFALTFSSKILSESHQSTNRAGYSVILLGHDAKGIELGFWSNEIWAQNSDFTHAESISIDTAVERNYQLQIIDEQYKLLDGQNTILSGTLRNYPTPATPYSLPNYVFLGDNTTSAAASVLQGPIFLQSNLSSVPEPSTLLLLSPTALAWYFRRSPYALLRSITKRIT